MCDAPDGGVFERRLELLASDQSDEAVLEGLTTWGGLSAETARSWIVDRADFRKRWHDPYDREAPEELSPQPLR